MDANRRE